MKTTSRQRRGLAAADRAQPVGAARRGFSMPEVLLAMGVFAIAFISIAAVFPVGAMLQKRTTDMVLARQVVQNAVSTIRAMDLSHIDHEAGVTDLLLDKFVTPLNSYEVVKCPLDVFNDGALDLARRSYPDTTLDFNARDFYWVPLLQRLTISDAGAGTPYESQWAVYVFVLKRDNHSSPNYGLKNQVFGWASNDSIKVPGVKSSAVSSVTGQTITFFQNTPIYAGDKVLDSNGIIHQVVAAGSNWIGVAEPVLSDPSSPWLSDEPSTIWYGVPPIIPSGSESPTVLIAGPLTGVIKR